MKFRNIYIFFAFSLLNFFCAVASNQAHYLNKVFHHQVAVDTKNDKTLLPIELGKVVFYFSKNPAVEKIQKDSAVKEKNVAFFFPMAEVNSGECKSMIKRINSAQGPFYTIKLAIVNRPQKGVTLTIQYNEEKIAFSYASFESIGLQKGLVFTFYNKTLIQRLKNTNDAILRTAFNEKKTGIVIDVGHGGSDVGTLGFYGLKEKDISLNVGLLLASLLRQDGFSVFLTRDKDRDVALDQRTINAHSNKKAALLVSIHANHSSKHDVSGIETFCLSEPLLKKKGTTLDIVHSTIVSGIADVYYQQSKRLASCLQREIINSARVEQTFVVDRRVKHAVAQVLLGASVPAVLVELGFLSNKTEAALLKDKHYQMLLAQGIYKGIRSYFHQNLS